MRTSNAVEKAIETQKTSDSFASNSPDPVWTACRLTLALFFLQKLTYSNAAISNSKYTFDAHTKRRRNDDEVP